MGWAAAQRYRWPVPAGHGEAGPPDGVCWVVTGHQPLWVHPGVWAKHALVDVAGELVPGCVGVNVVVDHDTASGFGAWVPWRRPSGELDRRFLPLVWLRFGEPFSQVPVPPAETLSGFAEAVREALGTLGQPGRNLAERFEAFWEQAWRQRQDSRHLAEWVTASRHAWEQQGARPARYLEVPMEQLAGGQAFLRFFAHLALDGRRFARVYNEQLQLYRQEHRIRGRANPFPELDLSETTVELPFWVVQPGRPRRALYSRPERDGLRLWTADGELARVPVAPPSAGQEVDDGRASALVEFVQGQSWQVRPRAVALTMFLRLAVADLFVHGIGGARYDRLTDAIVRQYFGVQPPAYGVCSATMLLNLPAPAVAAPPGQWRHRLHELRFNPQRFVDRLDPRSPQVAQARDLARQKMELVSAIQQPGAARRELTRRIETVNRLLRDLLDGYAEHVEACLRQSLRAQAERQAAEFREYPFFFYERDEVWRAVRAALESPRDAREPCRPPTR